MIYLGRNAEITLTDAAGRSHTLAAESFTIDPVQAKWHTTPRSVPIVYSTTLRLRSVSWGPRHWTNPPRTGHGLKRRRATVARREG